MAKGFKHGAGGANPLNFKVFGNPQPEAPKENHVWVDTDHEITSWIFSTQIPENPEEGMVWFMTGRTSGATFNALKKNEIWVSPQLCQQYIDGQWTNVAAKTYLSGEWKSFSLYLYDNGDECKDLTNGWSTKGNADGSISKNQTYMYVNVSGVAAVAGYEIMYTSKMIDLTNISRLCINVGSISLGAYNYAFVAVGKSIPSSFDACANNAAAYLGFTQNGLLELDVSQLTGEYYVWFGGRLGGVSSYFVKYTVSEVYGK